MGSIKQQALLINSSETKDEDYFKIYYKLVSEDSVNSKVNFSHNNKKELLNLFGSFILSNSVNIDNLDMKRNTKMFIKNIFNNFSEDLVTYLLNDFSDGMNTKMREKNNYAVLILFDNKLILAHTKMGELSINTEFKVFERLLDKDNVMRMVFFEHINNTIQISHYEKNKSKFFIDWLGLSKKELFYSFNGHNKFFSSINNVPIVLEINDEDLDKFRDDDNISIHNNSIKFSNPIDNLKFNKIMRYNKSYSNYSQFNRDYVRVKYNIEYYTDQYFEITSSLRRYFFKIYDCEDAVKSEDFYLEKEHDKLLMLFCNDCIEICGDFSSSIFSSIMNNEDVNLVHVGEEMSEKPLIIGNMKIYNCLNTHLTRPVLDYLNQYKHSHPFRKMLLYILFNLLIIDNNSSNIKFLFNSLLENISEEFEFNYFLKEDDILELKSRDFFSGDNNAILDSLIGDIKNKMLKSDLKLYLIGYDEKSRMNTPFLSQQYNDDRIEELSKKINKQLKCTYLKIFKISINIKECIFIMVVEK